MIQVIQLVNLAIPMPDLTRALLRRLGDVVDRMETLPWTRWLAVTAVASIPGVLLMGLVVATLARALRAADDLDTGVLAVRRPQATQLAEQRFANVVAEMAVAAAIPEPRVLIAERSSPNAVVLGADARHVTIVVSRSLLDLLDRDEMQGIAAHLVATIANGDVRAGARVALSLGLFGLITRLTGSIMDPGAAQLLPRLLLAALRPGSARARELLAAIADPFGGAAVGAARTAPRRGGGADKLSWREWTAMPFTGPLVMAGFFGGMVSSFVLSPLVALAWRQRKYLADSTAVRLTRNSDTLAEALQKMGAAGSAADLAPWAAHLAVVQDGPAGRGATLLSASPVPMFPGLERRLKALVRQGASVTVVERKVPPLAWLIGVPVGALVAALMSTVIAANTLPHFPGWRPQYWIGAMLGVVTAVLLYLFYRDLAPGVRGSQATYAASPEVPGHYDEGRRIYHSWRLWVLSGTIVFWSLTYVTVSAYVPTYLTRHYGLEPSRAAAVTSSFWIVFTVSVFLSGWLSDRLRLRKLVTAFGAITTGACFIIGSRLPVGTPETSLILLWSCTGFFAGFIYPSWCALYSETAESISPHGVGRAFGITATLSPIAGLFLNLGLPRVVESYGWSTWMLCAGFCCIGVALLVSAGKGPWWVAGKEAG